MIKSSVVKQRIFYGDTIGREDVKTVRAIGYKGLQQLSAFPSLRQDQIFCIRFFGNKLYSSLELVHFFL